ncbi:MAG: 2-oxoglutarate and iron-dependent oxygenase domain-containing protein [Cyanobacteria bacterium P01_F01_bin.86]
MMVAAGAEIPLIDFSAFLTEDPLGKLGVAADIYRACHEVGFLYLIHHGIPQSQIDQAFEQSQQFFSQPLATKQRLAWSNKFSNRGYVELERERLDETQPGDLKEAFNLGKEVSSETTAAIAPELALNRWPQEPVEFRPTFTEFFNICTVTAAQVFRAFAIALAIPEDFIAAKHTTHNYTLRLLHYPPLTTVPKSGQIRTGAHSDYGTLTLLFQDHVGGLEVLQANDQWIAAPSIPGAILVNTGDLTARWSNDVFRSTQQRVGLPQGENAKRDRYSIAFFCQPDADAEITCLPTCHGENNPPKYPPVKSGEYLLSRLQATY